MKHCAIAALLSVFITFAVDVCAAAAKEYRRHDTLSAATALVARSAYDVWVGITTLCRKKVFRLTSIERVGKPGADCAPHRGHRFGQLRQPLAAAWGHAEVRSPAAPPKSSSQAGPLDSHGALLRLSPRVKAGVFERATP